MTNIEQAAQKLAELFDYPWQYMPETGRETMRANVRAVLQAAGVAQPKAQAQGPCALCETNDAGFVCSRRCEEEADASQAQAAEPVAQEHEPELQEAEIGALCYRGNTVSFMHDKARAYGDALTETWDVLKEFGHHCDGATRLKDKVREVLTAQQPLAEPKAQAQAGGVREALLLAREYVVSASQRLYDGTNGAGIRAEATRRLALIDAALASPEARETAEPAILTDAQIRSLPDMTQRVHDLLHRSGFRRDEDYFERKIGEETELLHIDTISDIVRCAVGAAPAAEKPSIEPIIEWIRNNYQDHNIASLCEELRAQWFERRFEPASELELPGQWERADFTGGESDEAASLVDTIEAALSWGDLERPKQLLAISRMLRQLAMSVPADAKKAYGLLAAKARGAVVVDETIHSIEMDDGSYSVAQVREALLAQASGRST